MHGGSSGVRPQKYDKTHGYQTKKYSVKASPDDRFGYRVYLADFIVRLSLKITAKRTVQSE